VTTSDNSWDSFIDPVLLEQSYSQPQSPPLPPTTAQSPSYHSVFGVDANHGFNFQAMNLSTSPNVSPRDPSQVQVSPAGFGISRNPTDVPFGCCFSGSGTGTGTGTIDPSIYRVSGSSGPQYVVPNKPMVAVTMTEAAATQAFGGYPPASSWNNSSTTHYPAQLFPIFNQQQLSSQAWTWTFQGSNVAAVPTSNNAQPTSNAKTAAGMDGNGRKRRKYSTKSMAFSESQSESYPAVKKHIPRPMNAFMLYRKEMSRLEGLGEPLASAPVKSTGSSSALRRESVMSKIIAQRWKKLTSEQQAPWYEKAKKEKERHMLEHPNYRYNPKRKHKSSTDDAGGENDVASLRRTAKRAKLARGKHKGEDDDDYLPGV
jgi:hypothetical protein